jgi:hypothetical protein
MSNGLAVSNRVQLDQYFFLMLVVRNLKSAGSMNTLSHDEMTHFVHSRA